MLEVLLLLPQARIAATERRVRMRKRCGTARSAADARTLRLCVHAARVQTCGLSGGGLANCRSNNFLRPRIPGA